MSYSGSVGTTVINVQTLIDHGARRCGKLAEELTSEQLLSARQSLFFALSHIANLGIQYWAINKKVIGLNADQYIYEMPLGTVDVLNVLYRQMSRPVGSYSSSAGGVVANVADSDIDTFCQQASANGNIQVSYGTDNPIYAGSIGILPYVAGGGSALIHAGKVLEGELGLEGDQKSGVAAVRKALNEPLRWIAENAGLEGYVVCSKVAEMKFGHGFNAQTDVYEDLVARGVIDPVKVTRSALVNAASIASMLLTTEVLVVEKPVEEEANTGGAGHSHAGHTH
jgi:hypothetical protein